MAIRPYDGDELLTDDETAAELGKHTRTLKRWRDLRQGPAWVRVGREIFYRRESIRRWILAREEGGIPAVTGYHPRDGAARG